MQSRFNTRVIVLATVFACAFVARVNAECGDLSKSKGASLQRRLTARVGECLLPTGEHGTLARPRPLRDGDGHVERKLKQREASTGSRVGAGGASTGAGVGSGFGVGAVARSYAASTDERSQGPP